MSKYIDIKTGRKFDELPTVKKYPDGSVKQGGELTIDDFKDEGLRILDEQKAPEGTVTTKTIIEDVDGRVARIAIVATITEAEAMSEAAAAEETYRLAAEKAKADFEKWDKDTSHWDKHTRLVLAMAKPKEMSDEEWAKRFDEEWAKLEG
jgi:hypothetical protein